MNYPRPSQRLNEDGRRRLFDRVLRAAEEHSWRDVKGRFDSRNELSRDVTVIRRAGGEWMQADAPGVRYKVLWESAELGMRTVLYQMDAGTSYPAHVHAGTEECYVVQGDLRQEDFVMRAGDYQRVEAGSHHGVQHSDEGCLLFIRCSTSDSFTK